MTTATAKAMSRHQVSPGGITHQAANNLLGGPHCQASAGGVDLSAANARFQLVFNF